MNVVQWYPGHMNKAKNEIESKLKLVDVVIEVIDARAPYSSSNPIFEILLQNKPRIFLMTKCDLADPYQVKKWQAFFKEKYNSESLIVNLNQFTQYNQIINLAKSALVDKFAKEKAKGLKPRAIRAMIVGVPNVGKSTLINRLAKKTVVKAANTPGVTRAQQWIRYNRDFELLDTPGVLWPKFEDVTVGYRLALISAIKDTLIPHQDVALFFLKHLASYYPETLSNFIGVQYDDVNLENLAEICELIVKKYALKIQNGVYETAYRYIIQSFKNDDFKNISLEMVEDHLILENVGEVSE